jgi:hypothetical protein
MESNGIPNRVQVSASTFAALADVKKPGPTFSQRTIEAKGKGEIVAYLLSEESQSQIADSPES